jgi:hypothetical protein
MAERATISQICNIGVETTPGTGVAANKRLTGLQFSMGTKTGIRSYRASGYKYGATSSLNQEWAEGTFSGPLTYNELSYLLCGAVKNVTPTGAGSEKTWTFAPSSTAEDTVKTYTIELGSAVRAQEMTYGLITGLNMTFGPDGADVSAPVLGQAIEDGITLTSSPTEIALQPVTRPQISVKLADTQAGLDAASALTRVIRVDWNLSDRFGPVWALNESVDWAAHVEIEPKLEVKLLLQADATGMGLLTTMRNNATKFMRIEAAGPTIDTGDYSLQIDTALRVAGDPSELRDEDGVFAIEWTMNAFHDPTWGQAFGVVLVNELAAL